MLALLVRQRVRMFWNRLSRGRGQVRRLVGTGLATVFTVAFVLVAGLNAGALVERVARIDPIAATEALPMLLVGVAMLTTVTSLSSAFHHLFLAGDMELLLAAPVLSRSLLWLKVLEIWRDSVHVVVFQGAALIGFGQALRLPPSYYPLALATGLAFTLAASGCGAAVTLGLARVRFGESILGVSRVLAILLFVPVGVLGVPALGAARGRSLLLVGQDNLQAVAASLRSMGPPPVWAPSTWAAHLLLGDEAAGLSAALLLALGALLVGALHVTFGSLFQGGWERVRFAAPRRRGRDPLAWLSVALPTGPLIGLLQKDWRTLARDPRWRMGAVVSLVALGAPALLLFAGDPLARAPAAWRFWLGLVPVPYLAYLFGSQQGAATLAYEGRNIALLRAAPLGMGRIVLGKVLGGLVLVLAVTWTATLALAVGRGGGALDIGAAMLAATWLALGATLAAVAGAALTVDFDGDNPQRRVGCLGTIATSALSFFFFATNTALIAWWIGRAAFRLPRALQPVLPLVDWVLPGAALLSVAVIAAAARLGMRRLAAWEAS